MERHVYIDVHPSAKELAEEFCNMDDSEQAEFFNEIAEITKTWDFQFCFQLQAIVDNSVLTDDARKIMKQIGEYSKKNT